MPRAARSHIPIVNTYGTPIPSKPMAVRAMIKRSVRSAIPPEQEIPKLSALARIYGTSNPVTRVAKTT